MPNCTHKAWERDFAAVEGGMCPLCLQAELREAKAEVERLNDDLMACVAPAEVGGGIVNHVIERERKRAEQARAEVERLKASRDALDTENGRLVVENERLKTELAEVRRALDNARTQLVIALDTEREAHAKTRSGRDYIVAENVIAQREITERRAEVERMHVFLSQERDRSLRFRHIMEAEHTRADNLGAVIAELRAMVEQMPACGEFGTASGAMIKSAVLALIEDACREHGVKEVPDAS